MVTPPRFAKFLAVPVALTSPGFYTMATDAYQCPENSSPTPRDPETGLVDFRDCTCNMGYATKPKNTGTGLGGTSCWTIQQVIDFYSLPDNRAVYSTTANTELNVGLDVGVAIDVDLGCECITTCACEVQNSQAAQIL